MTVFSSDTARVNQSNRRDSAARAKKRTTANITTARSELLIVLESEVYFCGNSVKNRCRHIKYSLNTCLIVLSIRGTILKTF